MPTFPIGGPWFGTIPSPLVVNPFPFQQVWDWPLEDPYVFGLRDRETSIDLSTLRVTMGQGKCFYPWPPDDPSFPGNAGMPYPPPGGGGSVPLPEDLPRLNDPEKGFGVKFGDFSDSGVLGPVGSVHDPTSITRSTDWARMLVVKDSGAFPGAPTHQTGGYFFYDAVESSFMAYLSTGILPIAPFQANYTSFSDYLGLVEGVVHGPSKKALLFFFSGTYAGGWTQFIVRVCSPATDALGTRTVHSTHTFAVAGLPPLMAPFVSATVHWDMDNSEVRVALVYEDYFLPAAPLELAEVTIPLASIGSLLPTSVVADWDFSDDVAPSCAFYCMDAAYAGAMFFAGTAGIQKNAFDLVTGGVQGPQGRASILSSSLVELRPDLLFGDTGGPPDFFGKLWDTWRGLWVPSDLSFDGIEGNPDGELGLTSGADLLKQEVFRLGHEAWEVILQFRGDSMLHPGTINTGYGFAVRNPDDDYYVEMFLFYDYADYYLGVLTPAVPASPNYTLGSDFTLFLWDWTASSTIKLVLDTLRGVLDIIEVSGELIGSIPVASLPALSALGGGSTKDAADQFGGHYIVGNYKTSSEILGVVSAPFSGTFQVGYIRAMSDAMAYSARSGVAPHQAPYSNALSLLGTGSWSLDPLTDELVVDDTDFGDPSGAPQGYVYWTLAHPQVGPTSGATAAAVFKIESWTDTVGSSNPSACPIYAGLAIDDGSDTVMLAFTQTLDGRRFVYIPDSDLAVSLQGVQDQSAQGIARSAELDFTETHEYLLQYSPRDGIYLFVDGGLEASISIPSTSLGFDLPSLSLPTGASVGAMDGYRAVSLRIKDAVVSSREMYDMALSRRFSETELEERSAALSPMLLTVEDND